MDKIKHARSGVILHGARPGWLRQGHDFAANTQLQWHLIHQNSDHFGGLWEAGMKSLNYDWKRIAGKVSLTFEEYNTVITQRDYKRV